jgi:hypothetical protein
MIEKRDMENLRKQLAQLSEEERQSLLTELSEPSKSEVNLSESGENDEARGDQDGNYLDDIVVHSKLKSETQKIGLKEIMSCLPWILTGLGLLIVLTMGVKYGYDWLKPFIQGFFDMGNTQ